MDELPKLYAQEEIPETQKRSKTAIGILVFILLMLPVGVFLTLRTNNDLRSQAANQTTPNAENSLVLSTPQTAVNNQAVFPVDLIVRSDTTATNFFVAHLSFPTDKLEV